MSNRLRITLLIGGMVNAVLFGVGLLAVLYSPLYPDHLAIGIAGVVLASILLCYPLAWLVAPRLQARYDRGQSAE
jgi:hypothetical protein